VAPFLQQIMAKFTSCAMKMDVIVIDGLHGSNGPFVLAYESKLEK